jgi:hypothetical protein
MLCTVVGAADTLRLATRFRVRATVGCEPVKRISILMLS